MQIFQITWSVRAKRGAVRVLSSTARASRHPPTDRYPQSCGPTKASWVAIAGKERTSVTSDFKKSDARAVVAARCGGGPGARWSGLGRDDDDSSFPEQVAPCPTSPSSILYVLSLAACRMSSCRVVRINGPSVYCACQPINQINPLLSFLFHAANYAINASKH